MSYPKVIVPAFIVVNLTLLTMTACKVLADGNGILIQLSGDKLVTGFDDGRASQTIGDRAFSILFGPSLANNVPSFNSFSNPPAGSDPLPGGTELFWDFLPMTHNGLTSNLLYWDGIGTLQSDVEFGALPQNDITMSLYTLGFADQADIQGEPEMVPGHKIGTISSSSDPDLLHAHRWWFMESETSVPDGVYLMSLQVRSPSYKATDPFYVAASKNATALDLALPWVESQADSLVLDGDFNFDGSRDGFDFLAWQQQFGIQQQYPNGPFPIDGAYADGDGDNIVGAGDFAEWEANFGPPAAPLGAIFAVVPEPNSACLVLLGASFLALFRTSRKNSSRD